MQWEWRVSFQIVAQRNNASITRRATRVGREGISELRVADVEPGWSFATSREGKYLVLMRTGDSLWSQTNEAKLLDIASQKTYDIGSGLRHTGARSFRFTRGDSELMTCLLDRRIDRTRDTEMTVSVWRLDSDTPKICSTNQVLVTDAAHIETIETSQFVRSMGWIVAGLYRVRESSKKPASAGIRCHSQASFQDRMGLLYRILVHPRTQSSQVWPRF